MLGVFERVITLDKWHLYHFLCLSPNLAHDREYFIKKSFDL